MSKLSAYQRKARDFIQREDWQNALGELERMLGLDGSNPTLHNQIGDVYLRRERIDSACEHFERAIELYAMVGLHNNAVALCKKVMRLRPGRHELRYRLARLRLDQGFRSEAALFFGDWLDHVMPQGEHVEVLETRCREISELLPEDAPVGKMLEKLEAAASYACALEIVQRFARAATEAGNDAVARRYTEKMRSLRVLVERNGGLDLLHGSPGAAPEAPAALPALDALALPRDVDAVADEARIEAAPEPVSVLHALDHALVDLSAPALDDGVGSETARWKVPEATAPVWNLDDAGTTAEATPGVEHRFDLARENDKEVSPFASPMQPLVADSAAEPATEYEISESASFEDLAAFLDPAHGDDVAHPAASWNESASWSPPALVPEAELPQPLLPPPAARWESPPARLEPPANTSLVPSWSVSDLVPSAAEPWSEVPEPGTSGWVESLRHSPVWIPTGDALNGPDASAPHAGVHMELESVIDSFREQMSRALDGDGGARYDLGVAYFEMGLYNEALAEFEAASRCPGLEVQSIEMLAACLQETGRHADVIDLLIPVIAAEGHAPRGRIGLLYALARAFEALGDAIQARRYFLEVARADVGFKDVRSRLERLAS